MWPENQQGSSTHWRQPLHQVWYWSSEGVKRYWADSTWSTDRQTDIPTDRPTVAKQYAPFFKGGIKTLILLILTQKMYHGDNCAIHDLIMKKRVWNDVITTEMKSAVIHLLNFDPLRGYIKAGYSILLLTSLFSIHMKSSLLNANTVMH